MIDLLAGGRSGQLPGEDAAERQQRLLARRLGKDHPQMAQERRSVLLGWARGGTEQARWCRMRILLVGRVPAARGSTRLAAKAPVQRLWVAARRIDKTQLQAYSVCVVCNNHKGPNVAGMDPGTKKVVPLFNPRRHKWARHFRWDGPELVGITPAGRATVAVLEMNLPLRVAFRQGLIEEGVFPPA